tara:strand:- start:2190 stop:2786 length:597 start_codon:yes stop_codon:yes gene_type:complete
MSSSFKKFADDSLQPTSFVFTEKNLVQANKIIKRYPPAYKESSIMPLLTLAQEQFNGWLPKKAIEYVASFLNVSEIKVLELATFYSMYNLSPIGKYHIEVCSTTPCMLRGSQKILETCKKNLNLNVGDVTQDKLFSLGEVECLGACVNAPLVKIGKHYYEDLDEESINRLIKHITAGKKIKKGSQILRKGSEPVEKKL